MVRHQLEYTLSINLIDYTASLNSTRKFRKLLYSNDDDTLIGDDSIINKRHLIIRESEGEKEYRNRMLG